MLEHNRVSEAISPHDYRDAMSHFGGAVHIVTTDGAAGRRGVTAIAVCSVSDDPPTLAICLNRNREENRFFQRNGCIALNTLCAAQEDLARLFAGEGQLPMADRFAGARWDSLTTGAPILHGARIALDCKVVDVQSVHTHFVIFAQVVARGPSNRDPALFYIDRDYHSQSAEEIPLKRSKD